MNISVARSGVFLLVGGGGGGGRGVRRGSGGGEPPTGRWAWGFFPRKAFSDKNSRQLPENNSPS